MKETQTNNKVSTKRSQIHKHITNTTQYHDLLPNMYIKIRYMTRYNLKKKEEAQFPINHKYENITKVYTSK